MPSTSSGTAGSSGSATRSTTASRRAALRFGFRFEGVFRNHMVVKGRNRDTAWYAITDDEWPPIRAAFRAWLEPDNQGGERGQRRRLGELIAEARG